MSTEMNQPGTRPPVPPQRPRRSRFQVPNEVVWALLVAFMLASLVTAYLTFVFVRSVVASRKIGEPASPPVSAIANGPTATPFAFNLEDLKAPLQASGRPTPRPWNGTDRVNILFLGLDYRDWEDGQGPSRTDTMILFTLDPSTRSAGMLSIPRDLWVNIPGFDYAKINTAYFLGEGYQVPGGGPGLSIQTVEQLFDIQIHFYAQIDFYAFEGFIDELGGIEINVPEELTVDPIGPGNTVILEAGIHNLDGATALAYARNRSTAGSDFDRSQRQQQVIMAIRDRILNLDMLPLLIEKSPVLYYQLSEGVHTNMNLEQIISLTWVAQQVPVENIQRLVISFDHITNDFSYDGQSILLPISDEFALLREQFFTVGGGAPALPANTTLSTPQAQPVPTVEPEALRQIENARVAVLNGTYTPCLASRTADYLKGEGINITVTDNAQEAYELTSIIDYTGKIYTQQYLVDLLNIQPSQVYSRYDPNSDVDITILLGNDWATNNSMP